MGKGPQHSPTDTPAENRKRGSQREHVDRHQGERSDTREFGRYGAGERCERGERESHLGYPQIPRAIAFPD